jgi:outer membrane protein assembly factor BamA
MHKFLPFLIGSLSVLLLNSTSYAQDTPVKDSVTQINVQLINIFNQKTVTKYKIRNVKVVGNENFDENLLLSLSTLNTGDEVAIPGGDNFAKSIRKLMDQNYFSDVSIYLTDLVGKEIDVEINVTDLIKLRCVPILIMGVVDKPIYADQYLNSPLDFWAHDIQHSKRQIQETERYFDSFIKHNQYYQRRTVFDIITPIIVSLIVLLFQRARTI